MTPEASQINDLSSVAGPVAFYLSNREATHPKGQWIGPAFKIYGKPIVFMFTRV